MFFFGAPLQKLQFDLPRPTQQELHLVLIFVVSLFQTYQQTTENAMRKTIRQLQFTALDPSGSKIIAPEARLHDNTKTTLPQKRGFSSLPVATTGV